VDIRASVALLRSVVALISGCALFPNELLPNAGLDIGATRKSPPPSPG